MIKFIFILIFGLFNSINSIPLKNVKTDFFIALKQNNTEILKNKLIDISEPHSENYGKYLSIEEIKSIVSPDIKHNMKVRNWLTDNNIQVLNDYGDSLHCEGNILDLNNAFNITLRQIKTPGIYRSKIDYTIPTYLKDIIVFIEGLSMKGYERTIVKSQLNDNVDNRYAGKEVIDRLYNISNLNNINQDSSVCSVEYQANGGFSSDDLAQIEKLNGVPFNAVSEIIGRDTGTDTES